jgi:hypothetical protein
VEVYSNRSGNSPVTHYEIEIIRIRVWFKGGKAYSYSHGKAGAPHVEQMKILAVGGSGLSAYITRNVRLAYD